MTATLIPAAGLIALAIIGVVVLRRFPNHVRLGFDAVCFIAISLYFLKLSIFPVFPPLNGPADSTALWLRAVGGAWWLFGSRIIVAGLVFVLRRARRSREARLLPELCGAAVYIATAAVVLNSVFALPVIGVVATSGVVAIVFGLALQNTLADVFAGIAVGIEGPFKLGDRINISEKIEGQVVQINWRSIRIQTDGDDMAIIPNSLIAKAEIINRSYPSQRRKASVELTCVQDAMPEHIIETLLEAPLLCPDILRVPAPAAVLTRLGPKRNTYQISFFVDNTKHLTSTKDLLLRVARRQLHYLDVLRPCRRLDAEKSVVSTDQIIARRLLRDSALFECLVSEQINDLAEHLATRQMEPGEELFVQGAMDASLYIVASGILEVTRTAGGISETIGCIGAGEYVGEIGLLTGAPHAATATARTHCRILCLPREAIATLLTANAELATAFDKSVRRGLEALHRSVAIQVTPNIGAGGNLLHRIQQFFNFGRP
jgi:small-conductance mechanosensitive channel